MPRGFWDAGYLQCRPWPYAFGTFDNGVRIPDAARGLYLGLSAEQQAHFDDPFKTEGDRPFFEWLNSSVAGARPTRLLHHLYQSRPDLHFGDVNTANGLAAYSAWLLEYGRHELRLDDRLLVGLDESPGDWLSPSGLKRRLRHGLKRLYHSAPGRQAKATAKRLLGPDRSRALKQKLRKPPGPGPSPSTDGPNPRVESVGINLVGYLDAETGMGQAGRSLVAACRAADIPVSPHTLDLGVVARRGNKDLAGAQSDDFEHGVNLFVVNADQALPVRDQLGRGVYSGRYNIGLWLWEQEEFPRSLHPAFELYDEIWTPSTFCVDAIGAVSPVPVRRIPLPVESGDVDATGARARLGLPEDAFLFLFMFNFLSYAERKNPQAAVRAFKTAFGKAQDKALVLKTSQKDFAPEAYDRLVAEIGGADNILLIDEYLSSEDVEALVQTCDAYVSLHRSEGYGLTLAEAMFHGKPVVATPYSGVTDFFNLNNGYPVRYDLVTLEDDVGPYPAGSRWADADVEHAAEQMRRAVDDETHRARITEHARRDIRDGLSYGAVGTQIRRRLLDILRRESRVKTRSMPIG